MTPAIALHILKAAWPKVRWLLPYLIVAALTWAACDRYHRGATVPHTATAEVRLKDGTVLPARVPGGNLTAPAPTLPKGAKRIAAVQIKVQGGGPILKTPPAAPVTGLAAPSAPTCWDADDFTCPAPTVRIDVAIEDNQYRIAARSADGMLLESLHVPFATLPLERKYVLNATWAPGTGDYTAVVMRRLPWFGLSAGGGVAVQDGRIDPLLAVRVPLPW